MTGVASRRVDGLPATVKPPLSTRQRDALYKRVHARVLSKHADVDPNGACFFLNGYAALDLIAHGERAVLQAGSLNWPRIAPEQDDGVMPTHFSYVWSPSERPSIASIRAGTLPEMHVWLALPERGELVDMATGGLPAHCQTLIGYDWPGPKPPPYLWCAVDDLPDGVVYTPEVQAIGFALALVPFAFGDAALRTLLKGHDRGGERI